MPALLSGNEQRTHLRNGNRKLRRDHRRKVVGIFAAEVGFAETKNYVFKVMNNYRAYRELYNEQLGAR